MTGDLKKTTISINELNKEIAERKRNEEALRESEDKYRTILESIEDGYFEVDIAGNFTFFNDSLCKILGYPKDEMMGMNNRDYTNKENAKKLYKTFNEVYRTGEPDKGFDWQIIRKEGTKRHIEASVSLMKDREGQRIGFRGIARDITEWMRAKEALQQERDKLEDALAKVKTLSGLLPICANCKKIRDDKGYWNQIEVYIRDHSEVDFSHSICPECAKKLYPDFYKGD
jgi:PAS domain S-box-containing protein